MGLAVVFLACAVEYLFPPFPGDTLTVLAGVAAVRGEWPWIPVYAAATAGSVAGGAAAFGLGRLAGRAAEKLPGRCGFGWLTPGSLHGFEARFRRGGAWLLLFNRFMPGVRGPLFVAAGACAVPWPKAMVLGALSAAAWNALLLGAGWLVGGESRRLADLSGRYAIAAWIAIGVAAVAVAVRVAWRRRRARAAPRASSGSEEKR